MIPPNITNAELLDIVGDVYALIESGLLNKRVFDFPYSAGRFNFDTQDILSVLPDARNADAVEQIMSKTYVCDLGMDKIALLDKDNKLMKIVDLSAPIGTIFSIRRNLENSIVKTFLLIKFAKVTPKN